MVFEKCVFLRAHFCSVWSESSLTGPDVHFTRNLSWFKGLNTFLTLLKFQFHMYFLVLAEYIKILGLILSKTKVKIKYIAVESYLSTGR